MKTTGLFLLLITSFASSQTCYAQQEVHSGVLHSISSAERFNLIKIHCDALNNEGYQKVISTEFSKYHETVKSVDFDLVSRKIYIKYTDGIDPNMLLGILERVAISAYYYNPAGQQVFYTKSGNEQFRR